MKQKASNVLVITFLLLLFIDVVSVAAGQNSLHFWVKPLLMPVLAIYLFLSLYHNASSVWYWTLAGILFAWAGDVFLLFENQNPTFFLLGLGSFLCTHLCYILLFSKLKKPFIRWWSKNIWACTYLLGYGIILMAILWNNLGGMKIPVLVYASCITIMVLLSLRLQPGMLKSIWIYFAVGAILFFISDSILALNKFLLPIEFAGTAIMLTYGLAQFFITKATVKQFAQVNGRVNPVPAE